MRFWCLAIAVAMTVCALLGGCGGSGSGVNTIWGPYSPPENVIEPAQLENMAVHELLAGPEMVAGVGGGDLNLFAFARIPALRNLIFELLDWLLGGIGGIGDFLPLQAGEEPTDLKLLGLMAGAAKANPSKDNVAYDPFFEWTDPAWNIQWTGRIVDRDGTLVAQMRGIGPNTDCTVKLSLILQLGTRVHLTGSMQGHIAALVEEFDFQTADAKARRGRADMDGNLDLLLNAIAGGNIGVTANTALDGKFELPRAGGWEPISQLNTRLQLDGAWAGALALALTGTHRQGVQMGNGLYWASHGLNLTATVPDLSGEGARMNFTDDVGFADGKRGRLAVNITDANAETGGEVSGQLEQANGTSIATIDGTMSATNPATIHWADGTDEVIDWLSLWD